MSSGYLYGSVKDCIAAGAHLKSCDNDGYCNACGEQATPLVKKRVMVAGTNASGEPDFYFCIVECSEDEAAEGCHYDRAKQAAREAGYEEPFVAFDEDDSAGRALSEHFAWDSATVFATPAKLHEQQIMVEITYERCDALHDRLFELGRVSDKKNPFQESGGTHEWVQLTYEDLRIAPDGEEVAFWDRDQGAWVRVSDRSLWSDIIIGGRNPA